jgi:hypothetical protein
MSPRSTSPKPRKPGPQMNASAEQTPAPRELTHADIPAAVAFLEAQGYCINPPPPAPPPPPPVDMDVVVKEAEEQLAKLRLLEDDADARCMSTPVNDRDLPRYRQEATNLGHRVAQAEENLRQAIEDRKLFEASQ